MDAPNEPQLCCISRRTERQGQISLNRSCMSRVTSSEGCLPMPPCVHGGTSVAGQRYCSSCGGDAAPSGTMKAVSKRRGIWLWPLARFWVSGGGGGCRSGSTTGIGVGALETAQCSVSHVCIFLRRQARVLHGESTKRQARVVSPLWTAGSRQSASRALAEYARGGSHARIVLAEGLRSENWYMYGSIASQFAHTVPEACCVCTGASQ